jgi:hypothetical protein
MLRATLLLLGASVAGRAAAQPTMAVGAGVDTTARLNHELLELWRGYLRDRPDSARANRYWSAAEQTRWPTTDLTASWVYQGAGWDRGARATVVDIGADVPGDTSVFVVRTLFERPDSMTGVLRPVALVRVYAERAGGRWAFVNALPRLTRDWSRTRVGRIDFIYPAAHRYDAAAAERAARFVDSAAAALGIEPPANVGSYFAASPREVARVLGLDFGLSPNTGRVYAEDGIVVAGSLGASEWNSHDLAHVVLAPIAARSTRYWSEGVATWVGGRSGRDFPRLVRELDADLAHNVGRTLDSILVPHTWRDSISVASAAVLARLAFEHGGRSALERLVNSRDDSPDGIRRAAATALGVKPESLGDVWRKAVARYAKGAA